MEWNLPAFFRVWLPVAALLASAPELPAAPQVTPQREAVRFEIQTLPAAKRYVELAAYPSYLAIALQNNGFAPSQFGRGAVTVPAHGAFFATLHNDAAPPA